LSSSDNRSEHCLPKKSSDWAEKFWQWSGIETVSLTSGFALEAGLSSLADAPSLLRQYGVEPKPEHLTTLEGMLAALQSGAFDFVAEDEDLYTEADLQERYR
jgi:hypothetical protein